MADTPDWKETRNKILNQGVKEADLDKKVADYKTKFGQYVSSDDLIYFMIAQREYKLAMPKIEGFQAMKETTQITLGDVVFGQKARFVKIKAYVMSIRTAEGKNGTRATVTLADGRHTARLKTFKEENTANLLENIKVGGIYELDGIGVFSQEAKGEWKASCDLTWATNCRSEKIGVSMDKFLADAGIIPLQDRQPCFYRGLVIDDRETKYPACEECNRSTSKNNGVCANHPHASVVDRRMYKVVMSDGNSKFTADFGPRGPKDSVIGSVMTVVGIYDKNYNSISTEAYEIVEKTVVPKHAEVVKSVESKREIPNGSTGIVTAQVKPETKLRNITPDEVLIKYVQAYGSNPRGPIIYKLTSDCGMNPKEASDFLASRELDGVIKIDGETVRWVKS